MDHINEYLATACQNIKFSKAIRAALALGKETLNCYYNKTDHSDVYRTAMGGFFFFFFLFFFHSSNLQFYTPVINYNISRKLDGRMGGFKPLAILSVQNSIELMHLWMSKNSLRLLPLLPYVFFFSHSILDGNLFILQRSSSTNNIFDDLPALSAPSKSDLRDKLDHYLSTDLEHVTNAISW